MGTNLGTNYNPPSLVQLPSKGNKWYVVVTKPVELQRSSSNIQVRRSTSTTDRRSAEAALPGIAAKIYSEFDAALNQPKEPDQPIKFHFVTDEDIRNNPALNDPFIARRMLPPMEKPKDPATKLSRFILTYMSEVEESQIGDVKERGTKRTRCTEFLEVVGDLHIEDIKKVHAYQYAKWMHKKGLANKTIKSAISRVSVMMIHAEKEGIIDQNPFTNLSLSGYGKPPQSYLPFDPDEMKQIFAQKMPDQDRLALTLLATTGARLDEIALLEWSQVEQLHGITFLDIRPATKVKNSQSQRVVPVHSKVVPLLRDRGSGRLFDYPKDAMGKSQNSAGKRLAVYIDNVTDNSLKVVHSFRGTFKDMLKDAGVTPAMVEKLESGTVILSDIADDINSGQVSKELNDRITGHVQKDVAGKYGLGHALITRAAAVEKLSLSFLPD